MPTDLAEAARLDAVRVQSAIKGAAEEVEAMLDELLFTDVIRSAVCSADDFAFTWYNRKVFAGIDRTEVVFLGQDRVSGIFRRKAREVSDAPVSRGACEPSRNSSTSTELGGE